MSVDSKNFLGVGWSFPVTTDNSNKVNMSKYEQDISESIYIILMTAKGERVMRPTFGCGIHDFVFESLNASSLNRIETSVREALTLWEPRIQLQSVIVSPDDIDNGKLIISINYTVIATNNQFNMVYPFFLTEGT